MSSLSTKVRPKPRLAPAMCGRTESNLKLVATPSAPASEPLRILHISLSTRFAGSERYCADLANQQARMGHEVHVAAPPGSAMAEGLDPGVNFHNSRKFLLWRTGLGGIIHALQPDVCHAHLGRACKALAGVRTTASKVATLHVGYKSHHHNRMDGLICVNKTQAEDLSRYGGLTRVISNWLPLQATMRPIVNLRTDLGLESSTLVVGAVGRLHRSKGYDVLIQAFREAAPANAALVLVGEGPQRKMLERLNDNDRRVHFLGFRKDVAALIDNFDVFISPSREESFGLAIVEAMNAGLPIIATDTDGPREYLRSQPATLVTPGSVSALRDAIAQQFQQTRRAPQYNMTPFDASANIGRINQFYRDLRTGRRGP